MIAALFAIDEAGGMGKNGILPWPFNKDDMTWFKNKTQNQVVIMGRKTWESPDMPKPLPKRHNVVFTNNFFESNVEQIKGNVCDGIQYVSSKNPDKEIFIIGGANLLIQSIPVLDAAFITRIQGDYDCDTKIDLSLFLNNMKLVAEHNIGTCKVEEYETISRRT